MNITTENVCEQAQNWLDNGGKQYLFYHFSSEQALFFFHRIQDAITAKHQGEIGFWFQQVWVRLPDNSSIRSFEFFGLCDIAEWFCEEPHLTETGYYELMDMCDV